MPLFISALLGGLIQASATLVGRVLIALGIGFVTYTGLASLIQATQSSITSSINGVDPAVLQLLGVLEVDTAITMIFSAYAARMVLLGLTSGSLKRMVFK